MLQEQRHSIFPPKFKYVVMKHAFIKYQYFAILDCQREKGETKKKKNKKPTTGRDKRKYSLFSELCFLNGLSEKGGKSCVWVLSF